MFRYEIRMESCRNKKTRESEQIKLKVQVGVWYFYCIGECFASVDDAPMTSDLKVQHVNKYVDEIFHP